MEAIKSINESLTNNIERISNLKEDNKNLIRECIYLIKTEINQDDLIGLTKTNKKGSVSIAYKRLSDGVLNPNIKQAIRLGCLLVANNNLNKIFPLGEMVNNTLIGNCIKCFSHEENITKYVTLKKSNKELTVKKFLDTFSYKKETTTKKYNFNS
jgi:hypothetical protein